MQLLIGVFLTLIHVLPVDFCMEKVVCGCFGFNLFFFSCSEKKNKNNICKLCQGLFHSAYNMEEILLLIH